MEQSRGRIRALEHSSKRLARYRLSVAAYLVMVVVLTFNHWAPDGWRYVTLAMMILLFGLLLEPLQFIIGFYSRYCSHMPRKVPLWKTIPFLPFLGALVCLANFVSLAITYPKDVPIALLIPFWLGGIFYMALCLCYFPAPQIANSLRSRQRAVPMTEEYAQFCEDFDWPVTP